MNKAGAGVVKVGVLALWAMLGAFAVSATEPTRFPVDALDIKFPVNPVRPDDVVVIIGNADYHSFGKNLPDVVPAYADAESFFHYAVATLGVRDKNFIEIRDATGAEMIRLFGSATDPRGQLADWVKPGTDVTIYYSGHGAPGPKGEGSYLVPVDADAARVQLGGYALATLYANLEKLPARRVTVILEACFSGQSQGGTLVPAASGIMVTPRAGEAKGLEAPPEKTPPSAPVSKLTVISAGAADQVASWDEAQRSGLFTRHYLTGMAGAADRLPYGNGDGQVSNQEIKAYLDATLTYEARRFWGRDQNAQILAPGGLGPEGR